MGNHSSGGAPRRCWTGRQASAGEGPLTAALAHDDNKVVSPSSSQRKAPGHRFVEHTGEVQLVLEAPSLEALCAEAGRALAELLAGEVPAAAAGEPAEEVTVRAADREALLVEWVNELIFLSEVRKRIYGEFDFESVSEHELVARVRGAEPAHLRTAVKAATFHRLSVAQGPDGFTATLVLDV
jgi:SHS2 domain-containing protein